MNCKGIIFDLDGTLLDTLEDLSEAMNKSLKDEGLKGYSPEEYKIFIGNGLDNLVWRTIPGKEDKELFKRLKQGFNNNYQRGWADKTHPYEGIISLLKKLKKEKLPLGILSNKPHPFVVQCVDKLLPRSTFSPVLGASLNTPHKPDPRGALDIAEKWGASPEEVLFVGDTKTDMTTALKAGMKGVGVTWGFREEEELKAHKAAYIIHSPEELLPLLRI